MIVTYNLHDLPDAGLRLGIDAQHPDEFVAHLLDLAPQSVCIAAKRQRQSLRRPPATVEEFLATLERQGLPQTVAALRQFAGLL